MSRAPTLARGDRARLLHLARETMSERIARGTVPPAVLESEALQRPMAAFVTLLLDGAVRGSVGTVDADKPLAATVTDIAAKTAVSDPVFPPLSLRELSRTDIELSVLSAFSPITVEAINPGRHGLYLVRGPKRSVLLPQVARQLGWGRKELLTQLCLRAGLEATAWRRATPQGEVRLFAFEALVFSNTSLSELDD